MAENNKFGLSEKTLKSLISIFQKFPKIEKVIVYGSRAKGNFKPGSDIDLTLVAPSFTTQDLLKVENEIEDLLLPYKIDLSLLHQIDDPDVLDHIARIGKEFFLASAKHS